MEVLRQQLIDAGIDLSKWGTGQAKSLDDLQEEITRGETVLIYDKNGKLLRKVVGIGANIYYKFKNGEIYRLIEEKQIFPDGRERVRNLDGAVKEKMMFNENPEKALERGIKEELGVSGPYDYKKVKVKVNEYFSLSYPGLLSNYTMHLFDINFSDNQFKLEGYSEDTGSIKTIFSWEKINV